MREGGGQNMSVFVHAQGIKTVHAGEGVKKWQNSVHVVVQCPLSFIAKTLVLCTYLSRYVTSATAKKICDKNAGA